MLACSLKIPLLFCRSRRAPRSHKNVQRTFLWDALLRHPPSLLILHAGTAPQERTSCLTAFLFPSSAQEQLRRSALPATQPSSSHLPRRNSSAGALFLPLNLPHTRRQGNSSIGAPFPPPRVTTRIQFTSRKPSLSLQSSVLRQKFPVHLRLLHTVFHRQAPSAS